MSHRDVFDTLQRSLDALGQQRMSVAAFCEEWRAQASLLQALPTRYGAAMEDLLGRLEAGSLFSEESCSFSQADLQATLAVWLDKARLQLASQT